MSRLIDAAGRLGLSPDDLYSLFQVLEPPPLPSGWLSLPYLNDLDVLDCRYGPTVNGWKLQAVYANGVDVYNLLADWAIRMLEEHANRGEYESS